MLISPGDVEVCEVLMESGANVNVKNEKEDTPLMLACVSGHLPVVKLLLDHHASISRRGYHDLSALHEATEHGHYEVCSYLITAKGLKLEITQRIDKNSEKRTENIHRSTQGCFLLVQMLHCTEVVRFLGR